jgi:predicted site-specific integrase-resolvase
MDDLSRQIEFLQRPEYNEYILVQDIASGVSSNRKGLKTILDACVQGNVGEVVIAHKDRLARFGYGIIETVIKAAKGKITVLGDPLFKSPEQELCDDLLSIVHIFSCKQMDRRSYKIRHIKVLEDKDLPIKITEEKDK